MSLALCLCSFRHTSLSPLLAGKRFTVTSPETERHIGKGMRVVPLFPELQAVPMEASELAAKGGEFVVNQYRDAAQNLRTQFDGIIRRAELEAWSKLFENLRSNRQSELAEAFPAYVVSAWIGSSEVIARRHYLKVTEEHFAAASKSAAKSGAVTVGQPGKGGTKKAATLWGSGL